MATRIIILEDDAPIRRLYRTAFTKAGFDVRAFRDAYQVVEKAADFKPDIIITDLLMPKIDGYEAIRQIKADKRTRDIPVVVISNLGDYVSQQKSVYLGARDFIIKADILPDALVNRVRGVLSGKTQALRVDQKIVEFLKAEERARAAHEQLTPEERQYA